MRRPEPGDFADERWWEEHRPYAVRYLVDPTERARAFNAYWDVVEGLERLFVLGVPVIECEFGRWKPDWPEPKGEAVTNVATGRDLRPDPMAQAMIDAIDTLAKGLARG